MDRALPEAAEPSLPQSGEANVLRRICYAAVILTVATGGWIRFSDRIAAIAPGLAAPQSATAAQSNEVRGLLELGLTPVAASVEAVQAMQLPSNDAAALQQAISRRRVRLVQMPVFERDGGVGGVVQVSSAGFSQVVRLSANPVTLSIPVTRVGTVTFRMLGAPPPGGAGNTPQASLGIGALTLTGPVLLPAIAAGDILQVGIVAQ